MKKRRHVKKTAIVSLLLAASILSACGGGAKAPEGGNASGQNQGPIAIDWLAYNSYNQPSVDNPIGKMVQERFNATFNVWYIDPKSWDDNLNVKLGSGVMPDIMKIPNKQNIAKYVKQGILAPIPREMLEKYAPQYTKYIDDKKIWDQVTYDGKIYAIPTTNPDGEYPTAVVWREDWLKNVGITKTPETIQEYEAALTKFRNEDPDKNGKKDTYGMSDFAIPNILGAFGHPGIIDFKGNQNGVSLEFTKKGDKVVFAATQPEMKEALALLQKWYKDGLIDPEFVTSENSSGYWAHSQAFYNGRIGLTGKGAHYHWRNELDPSNPADKGGGSFEQFKKSQPNGTVALGKPAVGPQGKSGTPQWDISSMPVGITTKAAKDPRKMETLLKMVETAATDFDYYVAVRKGTKDVDYKLENDRYVNLITDSNNPEEKRGLNIFHVLVANDFYKKISGKFNYDYADKHFKYSGYSPVFVPPVDSYTKYLASLYKLTLETYYKIITGELPVSAFDDYVQKFKSGGGDAIEKEANEALAANKAGK
ncbi:extracellular solute-binding protein [Paenibacillus hamazuiensis]|uniref:extracellular solute-binding protein n=1 Tax=Paenibacillus hamazuiensis TaxID=2936508 RepID=UPI00200FFB2A